MGKYISTGFLNLKTCTIVDIELKRNEVNTYDSRLMKLEWDYNQYTFYTSGQIKQFDRPFTNNTKAGLAN